MSFSSLLWVYHGGCRDDVLIFAPVCSLWRVVSSCRNNAFDVSYVAVMKVDGLSVNGWRWSLVCLDAWFQLINSLLVRVVQGRSNHSLGWLDGWCHKLWIDVQVIRSTHSLLASFLFCIFRTVSVVCITASRSLSETSLLKPRNKQNYNECDSYSFQTAKTGSNIIF